MTSSNFSAKRGSLRAHGLDPMGLEAMCAPDPSDAGGADSGGLGQRAGTPVGGARRRFPGSPGNDLVDLVGENEAGPAGARGVFFNPRDAVLGETQAPAGHGLAGDSQFEGGPFGMLAGGGSQEDAGAFYQAGWEGMAAGKALEVIALLLGQPDLGSAGHDT